MDNTSHYTNRKLRIFISSTFKDMNLERDYLVNKIFPKVKEVCLKRNIEFLPLDLRWGITEEEAKQGHVIATCLEEVDNSRPFFIGILGQRYGWIPKKDDLGRLTSTLLQQYDWLEKDLTDGVSITEMEMRYAALEKEDIKHAIFYLRKSDMPMPDEFKEPAGSTAAIKLEKLKNKIRNQKKHPVKEYTSPSDMGDKVYEDIIKMIDAEFPKTLLNGDLFERNQHEFNITLLTNSYITNTKLIDRVNQWLESKSRYLVINGDKGTGKSSLMCYWLEIFRESNPKIKIIYHDFVIAGKSNNTNPSVINFIDRINEEIALLYGWKRNEKVEMTGCLFNFLFFFFRVMWMAIKTNFKQAVGNQDNAISDFSNEVASSFSDLVYGRSVKETTRLLKKLAKKSNDQLYVFIDNIDLIPDNEQNISWFLRLFPQYVRFVFTAQHHSMAETMVRRELSGDTVTVGPFDSNMSAQYITRYLGRYSKRLSNSQLLMLQQGFFTQTPQLLTLVLNQIISFGSFEELDHRINEFIQLKDKDELAVFSIQNIINEFEGIFSVNPAQLVLGAIVMSHKGLTEEEIQKVLGLRPIEWSMVRSHILPLCKCIESKYSMMDQVFASSVKQLLPSQTMQNIAFKMISYFEGLLDYKNRTTHYDVLGQLDSNKTVDDNFNNQRQAEELPSLYIGQKKWSKLFNYVTYVYNNQYFTDPERNQYWKALYDNGWTMKRIKQICSPSFAPTNDQIRTFYINLGKTATILNNTDDKAWANIQIQQDSKARKHDTDKELISCQNIDTLFLKGKYQDVLNATNTLNAKNPYITAKANLLKSMAYRNLGILDKALDTAWYGIDFARNQIGDEEVIAEAIVYYCSICVDSNRKELIGKAKVMLAEIYNFQLEQGINSETTFLMLNILGKIHLVEAHFPEAVKYFKDAFYSSQSTYGKDAYMTYVIQSNLGLALSNTTAVDEAEMNLSQGIDGMIRQKGKSNLDLTEPMIRYAMLLKFKKRYNDALNHLIIVDNLFMASPYANGDYHQFVKKQMEEILNVQQG